MMRFLLLCGLLTISFMAQAKNIYVETVGGNVAAEDRQSVDELIRMAIIQSGKHVLMDDATRAEVKLAPKLMKLGESYILGIAKTEKGRPDFATRIKAASISEIDTAAERVVRAVLAEQAADDSATVKDVTPLEENRASRRFQATKQWALSFGPGWSKSLNTEASGFLGSIGYIWGVEPHYDLHITFDGFLSSGPSNGGSMTTLALGASYLPSAEKHSPFFMAEFGYAGAKADESCSNASASCSGGVLSDSEASGWMLAAGVGYRFFRTSNVNLGVLAKYAQLFDSTSEGRPGLMSVRLAVYY